VIDCLALLFLCILCITLCVTISFGVDGQIASIDVSVKQSKTLFTVVNSGRYCAANSILFALCANSNRCYQHRCK